MIFSIDIHWHYFPTPHAKGVVDGIGGIGSMGGIGIGSIVV